MDLIQLRKEVDHIDQQMLSLMLRRMEIVTEVAQYKRANNLPVFAPDRENQILARVDTLVEGDYASAIKLLYGIIMDLNKLNEYRIAPKEIQVPTGAGGASVRAILEDTPSALCRYVSPLAASEVVISDIRSQSLPGGQLLVDIELVGDTSEPRFAAALSVLADTAKSFTLL